MTVVAALVLGGLLASASSAGSARARASALMATGSIGPQVETGSSGNASNRREGAVQTTPLSVRGGEVIARTSTGGGRGQAHAVAVGRSVRALDGLVTAYGVRREITVVPGQTTYGGRVEGLQIDGDMIGTVSATREFPLPDGAGTVTVNAGGAGIHIRLTKPRAGQPAGTELFVAVVSATATKAAKPKPRATPAPTSTPEATPAPEVEKEEGKPEKRAKGKRPPKAPPAPSRLGQGGYAFPVYGEAVTIADDFGGPRQIGPHQGNDIFAPFGSPVLAVADGRLAKVGTLPVSGNRLWLITDAGDAFFYAHLSSFSPLAETGRRVKAGDVLGFVGNTGDAEPTPPHVHFEIHGGGMDRLASDPHAVLLTWQRRDDVEPSEWLRRVGADTAERPGALVEVRDFIAGE